jgi:hypothetical protein
MLSSFFGGGTRLPCKCINPAVFSVAANSPTGTTAALSINWHPSADQIVFDMALPAGDTRNSVTANMRLWISDPPGFNQPGDMGWPVSATTDSSGSVYCSVAWDEKHRLLFTTYQPLTGASTQTVVTTVDIPTAPTVTFFLTGYPAGWRTTTVTYRTFGNNAFPSGLPLIDCATQQPDANPAAKIAVCLPPLPPTPPAPSIPTTYLLIAGAVALVIVLFLLRRIL